MSWISGMSWVTSLPLPPVGVAACLLGRIPAWTA